VAEGGTPINLALQGGGAFGAFTWGVLDRLLEDGRVAVNAISGTSAGAMNAAVLAYGLSQGGSEGGRAALDAFWPLLGKALRPTPRGMAALGGLLGRRGRLRRPRFSLPMLQFELFTQALTPDRTNPFDINPVRGVLEAVIDFEALRRSAIPVFVGATNVHTGQARIFTTGELTPDAVAASGALPYVLRAPEIDGVPYWDGCFTGDPPLVPLLSAPGAHDILMVLISPVMREERPRGSKRIIERMTEIGAKTGTVREYRALEAERSGRGVHLHRIDARAALEGIDAMRKLVFDLDLLQSLKEQGRAEAGRWLETRLDAVGRHDTLDLRAEIDALETERGSGR